MDAGEAVCKPPVKEPILANPCVGSSRHFSHVKREGKADHSGHFFWTRKPFLLLGRNAHIILDTNMRLLLGM